MTEPSTPPLNNCPECGGDPFHRKFCKACQGTGRIPAPEATEKDFGTPAKPERSGRTKRISSTDFGSHRVGPAAPEAGEPKRPALDFYGQIGIPRPDSTPTAQNVSPAEKARERTCPNCGRLHYTAWNDKGWCITCVRDEALSTDNPAAKPNDSQELEAILTDLRRGGQAKSWVWNIYDEAKVTKAAQDILARIAARDEQRRVRLLEAVGSEHQGYECVKGYGCDCSTDFLDAKDRAVATINAEYAAGENQS